MKVNLVNYEATFSKGILSKFAWKVSEELDALGIKNVVTDRPDPKFDINHHIMYMAYKHVDSVNTLMVTHVDTAPKIARLRECMSTADLGVCFSQETVDNLVREGFSQDKLTYVLPAHDEKLLPIPVAILTNVYPDGCKREGMLFELAKHIDKERFIFKIMGAGWDSDLLERSGLQFELHPKFDRAVQDAFLRDSKYYLYFGIDEGSMALLDAKNAGVQTIAPLDGFHIHAGVDLPFTAQEELNAIFLRLQESPLKDWTWKNHTKEHVKIWEKLLADKKA